MDEPLRKLADALRATDGALMVVTGAGISLASGIPTFRGTDPGAVWKQDVTELGTLDFFSRDPVSSWRWYLSRFEKVFEARPNPAHLALASLERWQTGRGGSFLLVTQNVDTLHEQAGTRELVKVHGSADRVRCPASGCEYGAPRGSLPRDRFDLKPFLASPSRERLPHCPACGEILRQHVLWFDEYYNSHADYQFERVRRACAEADLLLFVGTSFSVGLTEMLLDSARLLGTRVLAVDPGAASPPPPAEALHAKAEELLPAACRELAAR